MGELEALNRHYLCVGASRLTKSVPENVLRRPNPTLKYNPKNVKTEISEIGVKMGNGTFTKENNVTIANARCGSISELSYKTLRVLRTNSIKESTKPYRV